MQPITHSIIGLLLLISLPSAAQRYAGYDSRYEEPRLLAEVNLGFGGMNATTDLGGNKQGRSVIFGWSSIRSTKPGISAGITLTLNDVLAGRIEILTGRIEAHDSLLKGATQGDAIGRYERNLNFGTNIFEASVSAEFHPAYLLNWETPPRLSPYVFAGIGIMNFEPHQYYQGDWVPVRRLSLEGQGFAEYPDRKPYNTTIAFVPFGAGLRYELHPRWVTRLELNRRFIGMDYLDDVSEGDWIDPRVFSRYLSPTDAELATILYNRSVLIDPPRNTRPRGNPRNNDAYWGLHLKIGYNINRRAVAGYRRGRGLKCYF